MSNIKLVDKQSRSKLAEGRNYGLGFAFAKKEGDTVTTVCPITACKDFMSDVVYSQVTKKPYKIYGLSTSYIDGLFDTKNETAYMVASILETQGGGKYSNFDRDLKFLNKNFENMMKFINFIENNLKVKNKTKISKIKENFILIEFSTFWCQYTYLISLYCLLLRFSLQYDGKTDITKYIAGYEFDSSDYYSRDKLNLKLESLYKLDGKMPVQDMKNAFNPHYTGILNFSF